MVGLAGFLVAEGIGVPTVVGVVKEGRGIKA